MMHLTCIVFFCIAASSSLETTNEERPKPQLHASDLQLGSFNESDAEGHGDVVRRAVRKYPEDSEGNHPGHRRDSLEVPVKEECHCPQTMPESTVVVLVAGTAFLAFLPTVLVLAAIIWFLFCVVKVNKKEKKDVKSSHTLHLRKRPPPNLPPRPENTLKASKQTYEYERIPSAPPQDTQGVYLSSSELNPGPRNHREMTYQNLKLVESKSPREMTYQNLQPVESKSHREMTYQNLQPVESKSHREMTYQNLQPVESKSHREMTYQSTTYQRMKPIEPKTTPEGYISPERVLPVSTPPLEKRYVNAEPLEKKYMNIDHSHPTSLSGSPHGTTMSPSLSPKGRDNHIYEEIG